MTKNEMRTKLILNDGIGVEAINENGESHFYFYENFEDDTISRIYRHFPNEQLVFYSQTWAKQLQFKEYMQLYGEMVEFANQAEKEYEADPLSKEKEQSFNEAYKREFNYMMFLASKLIEWTNCSFDEAKKQVITGQVHYLRF